MMLLPVCHLPQSKFSFEISLQFKFNCLFHNGITINRFSSSSRYKFKGPTAEETSDDLRTMRRIEENQKSKTTTLLGRTRFIFRVHAFSKWEILLRCCRNDLDDNSDDALF